MSIFGEKIFTLDKSLKKLYNENMETGNSDLTPHRNRDYTKGGVIQKPNRRGLHKRIQQMEKLEDEFFTPMELAKLWKVKRATIYTWIRRGYLRAYKVGIQLRISKEDAVAFLRERVPDFNKIREKKGKGGDYD